MYVLPPPEMSNTTYLLELISALLQDNGYADIRMYEWSGD